MRARWMAIVGLAAAVSYSTVLAETPAAQLEKGIFQQETAGDLDAAEKVYKQIVDEANANRRFVAEAQFRIGECCQKQGKKAEAEAAFRQVIASYPDQVELVAEARKELGEVEPAILTVSKDGGTTGITLERAWILPGGLAILRIAFVGRVPFGRPPNLADPSKNRWGLKADEVPLVIGDGQLILEPPAQTEAVGEGGMADRWAGYEIFRFNPLPDGKLPVKLKYRVLLGRTSGPGEGDFKVFVDHVLNDPSSWELYEFSIPIQPYLTDRFRRRSTPRPIS